MFSVASRCFCLVRMRFWEVPSPPFVMTFQALQNPDFRFRLPSEVVFPERVSVIPYVEVGSSALQTIGILLFRFRDRWPYSGDLPIGHLDAPCRHPTPT